jgi:cation transport ATPase
MDPLLSVRWTFLALQTAPAGEKYEKDFLALAASLAGLSKHPAAADLRRAAKAVGVSDGPVTGFKDFPERGFGGVVQLPGEEMPRAVLMGELSFLEESGLQIPAVLEVARRRFLDDGARALVGGWDGHVRGVMRFRDATPRS